MELFRDRFPAGRRDTLGGLDDLYVYIDGEFLCRDEACISVWEHAFMYGDSVFEGIRAYGGKVFLLPEHLERLLESAKSIGIQVPLSIEELTRIVLETFRINALQEGHQRITVTRGVGSVGLDPRNSKHASVIAMAYPFPPTLGERAVRLVTSSVRRKGCDSVDAKVKVSNYMENILAKLQANLTGMDDALLLDRNGFVAEATATNVFVLRKGKWSTPIPVACLEGVTRHVAMEILKQMGSPVEERSLTPHELYVAQEVFLTGTGAGIVPVESVDGRRIGEGAPGEMTREVTRRFKLLTAEGTPIEMPAGKRD
ncbi:MAG: branched-chain amino acid aminotransferase [Actinobacteria bacterium]|nr:branched-chain amino acid aminotransferase [Actinomycetota bacterium]